MRRRTPEDHAYHVFRNWQRRGDLRRALIQEFRRAEDEARQECENNGCPVWRWHSAYGRKLADDL